MQGGGGAGALTVAMYSVSSSVYRVLNISSNKDSNSSVVFSSAEKSTAILSAKRFKSNLHVKRADWS